MREVSGYAPTYGVNARCWYQAMIICDHDLVAFLQWALPQLGRRWSGYRKVRGQVKGRIKARLAELGIDDLDAYRSHLEAHPEEWAVLDDFCRITISRFYRGRATFDALREEVLPALARNARKSGRSVVRAWCIGSASGEEAYTLRLCWNLDVGNDFPDLEFAIVGTDAGAHMIERARRACYPEGSLKELPNGWSERAFEKTGDDQDPFCLCDAFRRDVAFRLQDVRREQPDGPFDLVLCRYILFIYFHEDTQYEVLTDIVDRMEKGAALVIGPKEVLYDGAPFEPWFESHNIFRLQS